MKWRFAALLLLVFSFGCNYREQEEELQKREAALNEKEQNLIVRERTLDIREQEFLNNKKLADSVKGIDTSQVINPDMIGLWEVKMTCTESTCPGSAVGDTRLEHWNVHYLQKSIIVKAYANEQMVRVYTGFYTGNTVELIAESNTKGSDLHSKMIVRLHFTDKVHLEGQREIIRDSSCKVVYAVQMVKQN
jgi:hypothetical protein